METKLFSLNRWGLALVFVIALSACQFQTKKNKYSPITQDLITLTEQDTTFRSLLVEAVEKGKQINPAPKTNPAQTLEAYFNFIKWSATAMPWSVLPQPDGTSLYDKIDQSLNYFYFINDIPLDRLAGKNLYNNSLQYAEPYRSWLINYCKTWGNYLSTEDSWNEAYLQTVMNDPKFGLANDWYEAPSNWHSFNDFFSRYLKSPDKRPIAAPNDDGVVASPADSKPQGIWQIDANSDIVQKEGVVIKSQIFNSVRELIGLESPYCDSFANGTLTHSFLNVNDYHRYHFPMSGVVRDIRIIASYDAVGGNIVWSQEQNRYLLHCDTPGWQSIKTRGCVILETADYGLVALLPIGMSQVSSVNFEKDLKIGDKVQKGDMLGYFLFGGSDFVIIFAEGINFSLTATPDANGSYPHLLMGEELGRVERSK